MKFASFRINIRKITAFLAIAAAALTLASAGGGKPDGTAQAVTVSRLLPDAVSETDASGGPEADDLGDVGGEFIDDSGEYDGELSVPANISLDRLVISDAVTKPLESARVSSLFGYRQNPVTGKYSFHSGYDLAAPHGSDIRAMYSGTVSAAKYDSGYGNYIIIDHSGGFQTLYAHCSELLVDCGDEVSSGEVIARVGSTGNSTGAHLHVEFRRDGRRFDPEWILGGIY